MRPGQSLSGGAAGIALLRIEQARTGRAPWDPAYDALIEAVADGVSSAEAASLYHGAPALSFVLHSAGDQPALHEARTVVDAATAVITRRRLHAAHDRIDRHARPKMNEYDLISGLTGVGVALRRSRDHDLLREVLGYLVRLTEPIGGLPGWWTMEGHERSKPAPPGGHSNHGMAHGITGPLTLLAMTYDEGIQVCDQVEAMTRICAWLDSWEQRQDSGGAWWPKTATLAELDSGTPNQLVPHQPSWCYGTPGITRALHAASRAMNDRMRQERAERAFAACLADSAQLDLLVSRNLCHGTGGLLVTARRIAADSCEPIDLAPAFKRHQQALATADEPTGFLAGAAGAHLATVGTTATSWDACLLLS